MSDKPETPLFNNYWVKLSRDAQIGARNYAEQLYYPFTRTNSVNFTELVTPVEPSEGTE